MAIKGKTKRSQGRPVRRVTPGPRAVAVERRAPWYRAPAFAATLAIVALLVTLVIAVDRIQFGWARDDVARFTDALNGPINKVSTIATTGADGQPGFSSAAELATGKVKAADVTTRAQTWQQQLTAVRDQANAVTVGEVAAGDGNGLPPNSVGGRVRELSAIRDAYLTGVGFYEEAARAWQRAAEAATAAEAAGKEKNKDEAAIQAANTRRDQAIQDAQGFVQKGQQALDVAAALLVDVRARFALPIAVRMPGESAEGYGGRSSTAGGGTTDMGPQPEPLPQPDQTGVAPPDDSAPVEPPPNS